MNDQERFQNAFSVFELPQEKLQEVLHMYKLTEITQSTGLTESQIGLYIKGNLIHPAAEAQKHLRAGVLLEGEVLQLKAVQCLRVHEFGLEEIMYLTICGEKAQAFLQSKSEEKMKIYQNMEDVQSAIRDLQAHCPEGKELEKLQRDVRRYDKLPKDPNYQPGWWELHYPAVALTAIMGILFAGVYVKMYTLAAKILLVLVLVALGAMLALGGGILYLVKRKPPKAYVHKGMAVVEKVDRVTGFDTSFAMGRSIVPGAGFREQGLGGVWQFVFMFWNEIRPDNYFPIVRFTHNGQERIGTFRFGGFRQFLKVGDRIPVYWSDGDNGIVYPENTAFMVKKSIAALCIGAVLGGLFCVEIGPVFRAANRNVQIDDWKVILFGGNSEVFEGTEEISDSEINLEFTQFTGERSLTLNCREGDYILLEREMPDTEYNDYLLVSVSDGMGRMLPDQRQETPNTKEVYAIRKDGAYILEIEAYRAVGKLHAVVYSGEELPQKAADGLLALADSDTLALRAESEPGGEDGTKSNTTLYYDNGRYYQRTEVTGGIATTVQETLFDGTSGWMRTYQKGEETPWMPSGAAPVPVHIAGLRTNAAKLVEPGVYEGSTYLDGEFHCVMQKDYLERLRMDSVHQMEAMLETLPEAQRESLQKIIDRYLATTYTHGDVYVEIDEETGKAVSFDSILFREEQQGKETLRTNTRSFIEVIGDADPKAEIERILGQL